MTNDEKLKKKPSRLGSETTPKLSVFESLIGSDEGGREMSLGI